MTTAVAPITSATPSTATTAPRRWVRRRRVRLRATWSSTPAVPTTGAASRSARCRRRSSAGTAYLLGLVAGGGGFVQQRRQGLAGAEEHRLHRAFGDAEVLGDLADVEAEVVPQHGHLPLAAREREQRFPDRVGVAARGRGVGEVVAQRAQPVA